MSDGVNNDFGETPPTGTVKGVSNQGSLTPGRPNAGGVQAQSLSPSPQQYTVQFNISFPNTEALPPPPVGQHYPPIFAIATIQWSVGGNSIQRKVLVGNGTSISGLGEGVTVSVKDATPTAGFAPYPAGTTYPVTVSIAPGTRASNQQQPIYALPETTFDLAVLGTSSVTVPVDPSAGCINAYIIAEKFTLILTGGREPAVLAETDLVVWQQVNGISLVPFFPSNAPGEWVPLIPGCTGLLFQANVTPGTTGIQISVLFGIDG